MPRPTITPQAYVAAETRTAQVRSIGGNITRGVAVVVLSDGASIRMHGETARIAFNLGDTVAYDVDGFGNRFNPRTVTAWQRR